MPVIPVFWHFEFVQKMTCPIQRALKIKLFSALYNYRLISLLSARSVRNNKPPAMRVRVECYTKKSPFRYNVGVQATLKRKER